MSIYCDFSIKTQLNSIPDKSEIRVDWLVYLTVNLCLLIPLGLSKRLIAFGNLILVKLLLIILIKSIYIAHCLARVKQKVKYRLYNKTLNKY